MSKKHFEIYSERLTSYDEKGWPADANVYIKDLVEAGFVYTGENDMVYCFRCGITASNWEEDENPLTLHGTLNKHCPYLSERLQNVSSVILNTETRNKSLEDYERESYMYDWIPGQGVTRRLHNIVTQSAASENGLHKPVKEKKTNTYDTSSLANEIMRSHDKRFQSFVSCPVQKHWPPPENLAAAGFYYKDNRNLMICFCCGISVDDWQSATQDAMLRHRSLSPKCGFAQGSYCGNIPCGEENILTDIPLIGMNISSHEEDFRSPLQSPIPQTSLSYNSYNHKVEHHQEEENAHILYQNVDMTHTPLVQPGPRVGVRTTVLARPELPPLDSSRMNGHHPHLATNSISLPRTPSPTNIPAWDLSDKFKRLQTFLTWPRYAPIKPEELADAGFFYIGREDGVRCYKCNVCLKQWDEGDKAWTEHEKHSPICPLVIERIRMENQLQQYPARQVCSPILDLHKVRSSTQHPLPPIFPPHQNSVNTGYHVLHLRQSSQPRHYPPVGNSYQRPYQPYQPLSEHNGRLGAPNNFPDSTVLPAVGWSEQQIQNWIRYSSPAIQSYDHGHKQNLPVGPTHCWPSSDSCANGVERSPGSSENMDNTPIYPYQGEHTRPPPQQPHSDTNASGTDSNNVPRYPYHPKNLRYPVQTQSIFEDYPATVKRGERNGYTQDSNLQPRRNRVGSSSDSTSELIHNRTSHTQLQKQTSAPTGSTSEVPDKTCTMTKEDWDNILELGYPEKTVIDTVDCYTKYSQKPFNSLDDLAQAIMYYRDHGNLEGTPFGEKLNIDATEDGKSMICGKVELKSNITEEERDGKNCKICMDADVEVTFVPCGHLVVCSSCALGMKTCPICRFAIKDTVRTFGFW